MRSAGLDARSEREPGFKFQGEKQDFEEMVGNLLDNACKWASSEVKASALPADGGSASSSSSMTTARA